VTPALNVGVRYDTTFEDKFIRLPEGPAGAILTVYPVFVAMFVQVRFTVAIPVV
jgi:hypothetical protein